MSIVVPFNFNPTDTQTNASSYSPSSGTYALVTIVMSVTATSTCDESTQVETYANGQNSATAQVWLKSTDTISKTETTNTATTASNTSAKDQTITPLASYSIDVGSGAVVCGQIECTSTMSTSSGNTHAITGTGTSDVKWFVQEFNEVT